MPSRSPALLLAALAATALPSMASADAAGLYYERSLMSAAGDRCGLFDTSVASALTASTRQARGAALRGGAEPQALDAVARRARDKAAAAPCGSPDLALVAERVRTAFAGYSRIHAMTFPGGVATWKANRNPVSGWLLSQPGKAFSGPVLFGIAQTDDSPPTLTAVAGWGGAQGAATARLVVRDTRKAPHPYLDPRRSDLAGQLPPRAVTRVFLASARDAAATPLLPSPATEGAVFRFPAAAALALERLDPREGMLLELVYPARTGERVERVVLEVGDFAAGRAFLAAEAPAAAPRVRR